MVAQSHHRYNAGNCPVKLEIMAEKVGVAYCGEVKVEPYERAMRIAGLEPVRLRPGEGQNLSSVAGLLLTGGVDVNPRLYGQDPVAETDASDDTRDRSELSFLGEALEADLPVLAICRGMQLMNVHLHGTLQQHLPSTAIHKQRFKEDLSGKHRAIHEITVNRGTKLAAIVGDGVHAVNSRHHQSVDRLGQGAIVNAISTDGVIEGLELPSKRFVLAVQWHPEDRIDVAIDDRKLFEAFAAAVQETPQSRVFALASLSRGSGSPPIEPDQG
jgi:putative glutamine amidotransferase